MRYPRVTEQDATQLQVAGEDVEEPRRGRGPAAVQRGDAAERAARTLRQLRGHGGRQQPGLPRHLRQAGDGRGARPLLHHAQQD